MSAKLRKRIERIEQLIAAAQQKPQEDFDLGRSLIAAWEKCLQQPTAELTEEEEVEHLRRCQEEGRILRQFVQAQVGLRQALAGKAR